MGANAIIDNHLIHGIGNRSGEIGHFIVDPSPDAPKCGCGHKGCLEALLSGPALAAQIRKDLNQGKTSTLAREIKKNDNHRTIIKRWGLAIQANDAYALSIQDFVTTHLSRAIALAINLYDPERLILAGYVSEACFASLAKACAAIIKTHVYDGETRNITIHSAQAGDQRYTKGAAIAVLTDDL